MLKKLCVTGFVAAAAAGVTLMAVPAHADTDIENSSWNEEASQSGNNFNNVGTANTGGWASTNVNNINGNAVVATNRSRAGFAVRIDD
ncbi:hypothetical protein [Nonomuraea sp. LPB2021202275-12-8]|uniref:hypothetical protein n=1 Tax=Nonomuraea sp. LPB2021202275-12-8 TaxID=3120159 RepID=UPI00300C3265